MRKSMLVFVILFFLPSGSGPAECDPNYGLLTKVEARAQETGSTCWAAAGQMAMACHGEPYAKDQCRLVTEYLNPKGKLDLSKIDNDKCRRQASKDQGKLGQSVDCCQRTPNGQLTTSAACYCSITGLPDFKGQGFNFRKVERPTKGLDWNEVTAQICHGHPIVVTFEYPDSAHQKVASGYKIVKGTRKRIFMIDPMGPSPDPPGHTWLNFQTYTGVWGGQGKHSTDFVDIFPASLEGVSCK